MDGHVRRSNGACRASLSLTQVTPGRKFPANIKARCRNDSGFFVWVGGGNGVAPKKMKTGSPTKIVLTAAARVAGEDLDCGDYISLLNETVGLPSFLWNSCGATLPAHELVRLTMIPANAGQPLKVIAVCLPFVYTKTPGGEVATIDTRRTQLVRLNRQSAKVVWKALKPRGGQATPPAIE
jgi:hypothetical protein